jgi:hypothetical protein
MEAMRNNWTDDRLDDFAGQVWRRFDEVDRRFDRLEDKLDARFDKIDARFEKIDARFERIDERFEGLHFMMHRTMIQLSYVLAGTLALGFLSIIATQLFLV